MPARTATGFRCHSRMLSCDRGPPARLANTQSCALVCKLRLCCSCKAPARWGSTGSGSREHDSAKGHSRGAVSMRVADSDAFPARIFGPAAQRQQPKTMTIYRVRFGDAQLTFTSPDYAAFSLATGPSRLQHASTRIANLKFLSEIFKNYIADQCGNCRNKEVGNRENILNSKNQALSLPICMSKFPHQKIGIKYEDYEAYFDYCSPNRGQLSRMIIHCLTISTSLSTPY